MEVYVLQHVHEFEDGAEDVKFVGVFTSREHARAAVERLKTKPGFRDHPQGFHVDPYTLDEDHWAEGFTTD